MLIEFRFKNFLSYRDEVVLSMTNVVSFKEHIRENLIATGRTFDLLKTAAIFGSNGRGKSNFIAAMGFLKDRIHNSYAESLKEDSERTNSTYYFRLNENSENEPSLFEVSFLVDKIIYRYGFEILGTKIVKEWLFRKSEVEVILFERTQSKFKINKTGLPSGQKFKNEVNQNVLFLSHLAQNNVQEITDVFNWFRRVNVNSGLKNSHFEKVTKALIRRDSEFKIWLSLAVKFLEISNVELSDDGKEVITYHNKFDSNHVIVGSVPFKFHEESEGTRKLIYFLGALYDTLMNGKVLFIDELDSKLHPNLTVKLLEFFHRLNKKGAQIIFTAHDSVILDKDFVRRDQVWFVDRNRFGESQLYSMADFNSKAVRKDSDFRRKYLSSTFGAAETMSITEEMEELLS